MTPMIPPGFVEDDTDPPLPPGFVVDPLMEMGLKQKGPTIEALGKKNAAEMGPFRKALYGGERAFDEAATGLKQIFPKALGGGLGPQEEQDLAVRRATEKAIPGHWASRLVGDVAMALPIGQAANAAGNLVKAAPALAKVGTAALAGAGFAAAQPVLGPESRADNAKAGAIFGGAGQAIGSVAGKAIEGIIPKNPQAAVLPQAIRDKLSLGQIADPNTVAGKIAGSTEEHLQSVPLVGALIRNKRANAVEGWRNDLIDSVAPKGHVPAGETTWDKVGDIAGQYRNKYSAALANHQVPPSRLFESSVANITNNPRSGLTQSQQTEVRNLAMDYYNSMFHGNVPSTGPAGTAAVLQGGQRGTPISADAATAKDFEAFLTKMSMQYKKSNAPGADNIAKMFDDLERAWSVSYRRALPSSARKDIKGLDQTYAPFKTIERAASYTGAETGNFSPAQMVQAVRARTPLSKFARGGGILQDEAAAAKSTMMDRVPNSGTTDRAMTVGAVGGAILKPVEALATLGTAIPAMVTKTGRNVMTGDTKTQELLKRLRLNEALRGFGSAGGMLANDAASPEYSE